MALRTFTLLCIICSLLSHLNAQSPVQSIRGIVRDKPSQQPLQGVRVSAGTAVTVSDANGAFSLENIPAGRVKITAEMLGYQPYTPEDVLLLSTRSLFLEIDMIPGDQALKETVVSASRNAFAPLNDLAVVSTRSFTVDETERVAAGVNDPGRVALSYPGVQKGEDETENQIVTRGNSPTGILWRLEGIDIPNPNHFALIGSSGGGLTVFSAQLLSRSDFSSGGMPAEYGNALSGAFDIHFRHGNDEYREHRAKISLLGIDLSTEGPIRSGRSSYLINYRYSTLGLLNKMGFHLVGERVSNDFQDLSYNLVFKSPDNKRIFTLFGMGGLSEEHYSPVKNPEARDISSPDHWEDRVKPANMATCGATWTFLPDDKSYLKLVVALIGSRIKREYDTLDLQDNRFRYETQAYTDRRIAASVTYSRKITPGLTLKTGAIANQVFFDFYKKAVPRSSQIDVNALRSNTFVQGQGNTQLLQQYAQVQWRFAPRFALNAGYHAILLTANRTYSLEPRASVQYHVNTRHRLSVACGWYSKTLPLMAYFVKDSTGNNINKNLELLKSRHFIAAWHWYARSDMRVSVEAYLQQLYDVPIETDPSSTYWMLNFSEGFPEFPVVSKGKGWNRGVDIALEKKFAQQWFFLVTGSTLSAKFRAGDGRWYHSRFDTRFSSSATVAKEFRLRRSDILQVGGRFLFSGGFRYTPYDPVQSAAAGYYVPLAGAVNEAQVPAYKRLDTRVAWRMIRKKFSGNLSLDIQNPLNATNAFRVGYDPVLQTTFTDYRGSLVPVLGFQADF